MYFAPFIFEDFRMVCMIQMRLLEDFDPIVYEVFSKQEVAGLASLLVVIAYRPKKYFIIKNRSYCTAATFMPAAARSAVTVLDTT